MAPKKKPQAKQQQQNNLSQSTTENQQQEEIKQENGSEVIQNDIDASQSTVTSTVDATASQESQTLSATGGALTKGQLKKLKAKQKKTANSKVKDIKRKLSCDPNSGPVTFLKVNQKVQEKLPKSADKKKKKNEKKEETESESESENNEDSSDADDNEDFIDYKIDGYHAMHIGEILDGKYIILKKLGWGHFSTVWLSFNIADKKLYALKILRSAKKYLASAYDEEAICKIIADNYLHPQWTKSVRQYHNDPSLTITRDHTHTLQMYDWFNHHGTNGKHFTMAFEVLGRNLLSLVKKYDYHGIPIPIVREITRQLLMSLDYMHRICKLIHTDLKPENITFALREEEEFDLLYKHVFCSPLIDLFETKEKIILNNKQLKNQKKKDRKKKKKQQAKPLGTQEEEKQSQVLEDNQSDDQEEETNQQEENQPQGSKAQQLIQEMRNKIVEKDKKYHITQNRRNQSEETRYLADRLLTRDEKDDILEHPQRRLKNGKPKQYMRLNSQTNLWSDVKKFNDFKPMEDIDLKALKEMQFQVKMVDMGNACYIDEHFSDIIQTRQYRSPEVIIRADYDTSADMWSLACTVFELVTGDYLFEPKKGKSYTKNEDHLALITELLGECKNKKLLLQGTRSDVSFIRHVFYEYLQRFYDKNGKLKNIKKLKYWSLRDVLIEKYRLRDFEATALADFLNKMLKWDPKDRATAQEMMNHHWLKMMPNYSTKMGRSELREFKRVYKYSDVSSSKSRKSSSQSKEKEEQKNNAKKSGDKVEETKN
eukprot:403373209